MFGPISNTMGVSFTKTYLRSLWPPDIVCRTACPGIFDLTNSVKTSLTSVGSSADSPEPFLRPSPATGHDAEMLDV